MGQRRGVYRRLRAAWRHIVKVFRPWGAYPALFAAARAAGVLGLVYLGAKGYRDWRLDQDGDALGAFPAAAQGFG